MTIHFVHGVPPDGELTSGNLMDDDDLQQLIYPLFSELREIHKRHLIYNYIFYATGREVLECFRFKIGSETNFEENAEIAYNYFKRKYGQG